MAPEVARDVLAEIPTGSRVVDPMCGSGTVLRHAVEAGHECTGRDIDPLAVIMARGWTSSIPVYRLTHDAAEVVRRASAMRATAVHPPWDDGETEAFARYWFASTQYEALTRLSSALRRCRYRSRDLLILALSRLIITKDRGASLARDVSHSRPHRVRDDNDFDVYDGFLTAARLIAKRLEPALIRGHATVEQGDARLICSGDRDGFDIAITSPPYLNAIDYLRGHRLTLIWLGYSLAELRALRAAGTGSERAVADGAFDIAPFVKAPKGQPLPDRYLGWVRRYSRDAAATVESLRSAVRPNGKIVLVVGNSLIRGARVDNAGIIRRCAADAGLDLIASRRRNIPARRRYLPPPHKGSALATRMRTETVLTFVR
jgi:SAM-dependent methyltransferase